MKTIHKMPKFTDEELKKYYDNIYKSHKVSEVKKYKEEVRKFKRKGGYEL